MDRYIFPAIFEPGDKKGYCITFPDLPGCITEGDTLEEALYMAKDALELHLWGMEDDGDHIPNPTPPEKIKAPKGAFVNLIEVWMPPVRDEMVNKAVKKTLTLPKWLNDLAERKQVNFSRVLQSALKSYLGIAETPGKEIHTVRERQVKYQVGKAEAVKPAAGKVMTKATGKAVDKRKSN